MSYRALSPDPASVSPNNALHRGQSDSRSWELAHIVEALYGGALKIPAAPRTDLLPLVTYAPPIAAPGTPAGPVADMLRLNTGVSATPLDAATRLGLIGGDPAPIASK